MFNQPGADKYCTHIIYEDEPPAFVLRVDRANFVLCAECISSIRGQILSDLAVSAMEQQIRDELKNFKTRSQ